MLGSRVHSLDEAGPIGDDRAPMELLGLLLRAALAAGVVSAPLACDSPGAAGTAFDAERAWKDLEHIVAFGARPSGSPALEEHRKWLESELKAAGLEPAREAFRPETPAGPIEMADRKSTRLNSSHVEISYAVFCLKKKKQLSIRRLANSLIYLYS